MRSLCAYTVTKHITQHTLWSSGSHNASFKVRILMDIEHTPNIRPLCEKLCYLLLVSQVQCLQLRFQTKKFKIHTKSGLILGKIRTISFKNLDSIKESRLFWIFKVKSTMNDLFKRFQKKPVSCVILLIFLKVQTFDKNPDQIRTSLVKKVRIRT